MATVTGEQKTWHKITLDFEAPRDFTETASTFRDYRLDVTFRNADTGEILTLPGYFAADGNAANSNATSGNVWRVNFNPPSEGNWTYEASFRTGSDIAAKSFTDAPNAGQAVDFIDGDSGTIQVSVTDKSGDDFRAKGMIVQDEGTHYLQHQGDLDYFVRGGPGIPENFLANKDFDNTTNGRHDYSTHLGDFNSGDPTWDGGKGKAIIGASNYIAEQGLNTIYLLTNTSGGDGQDVSPWTFAAQDTPKFDNGLSNGELNKFSTYDVSKLSQWEIVFDHLDNKGIYKNVLLQETENDQQLDGGTNADGTSLSVERLVYIREMVARFGHNNGIQWNIGEENTNSDQQRADQAEYLKSVDGYDHLVVIHSFPGDVAKVYNPLLDDTDFDGTSFQATAQSIRAKVIEYRDKSDNSGDPWVLAWDEDSSSNGIVDPYSNNPDSNNEKTLREAFWGTLTAGGSGGNWYFKGSSGHSLDQNYDTFEAHASVWKWTAAATDFFNTYIPFWNMKQADNLTSDNDDFVMAQEGEYYVIYAPYGEAGDVKLNLNGQGGETFDVFWYNPRTGGDLIADGQVAGGSIQQIGGAPSEGSKDWVILVRNSDAPEFPTLPNGEAPQPPVEPPAPPTDNSGESYYEMESDRVVMQAEDGTFVDPDNPANATWELTQQFAGSKGDGVLLWTGNDYFGDSNAGTAKTAPIEYNFEVTSPGTYYISLRATRPETGEPGDRNNDFFVQFEDEGFKKLFFSGEREKFSWGTTYDHHEQKSPSTFAVTQAMIDANDGIFTLTLSARSRQAAIDEIHIQKGSFSRDNNAPTSQLVDGDSGPVVPVPPVPEDNEAPVAVDDTASTDQNKTILVDVLANDTDADGNSLSLTNVSYDGNTSVVTIENGKVKVNPLSAATQDRTETITYTLTDSGGKSDTGTLLVDIGNPGDTPTPPPAPPPTPPTPPADNQAPVAIDDTATTAQNKTIVVDVLGNDGDPDGDGLTLKEVAYGGNTSIVSIQDGKIKVNPLSAAKNDRVETITYTISDEDGATDTATLTVDIGNPGSDPTPPPSPPEPEENKAPVANDDVASTAQNKTIVVDVLGNDSDPEAGPLTLASVQYDGNTSIVTFEDNKIKVNPLSAAKEARVETITYTVADEDGATDTATLQVSVGNPAATLPQPVAPEVPEPPEAPEPPEEPPVVDQSDGYLEFFFADTNTDLTLRSLTDGDTIDAGSLGDATTIYATSDSFDFDRVTLTFEGVTKTEKMAPYALFGDSKGDFFGGLTLNPGSYNLAAKGFDENDILIETVDLGFDII